MAFIDFDWLRLASTRSRSGNQLSLVRFSTGRPVSALKFKKETTGRIERASTGTTGQETPSHIVLGPLVQTGRRPMVRTFVTGQGDFCPLSRADHTPPPLLSWPASTDVHYICHT